MRVKRAFTLIEMILAMALMSIVLGAVAGIYLFSTVRLSDAYTKAVLMDQVNGAADRIAATVRNADNCVLNDGGSTLKCGMPVDGADTDGDGHLDAYFPDKVDQNGAGVYTIGNYVWFYNAGATGAYHTGSGMVWRAEVTNAGMVATQDIDRSFAYESGTRLRFPLVNSVSFSVDVTHRCVTYAVAGSTRIGKASSNRVNSDNGRQMSVTRTVYWRN